jgi:serine protease inhibitor
MEGNAGVETKTLQIDRPFVFMIRDTSNGSVLFVGQVADPTATST